MLLSRTDFTTGQRSIRFSGRPVKADGGAVKTGVANGNRLHDVRDPTPGGHPGTPIRRALRRPDFGREREERIEELYRPYHRALSACVVEQLRDAGTCLVIDAHSFPRNPLPYEDATAPRPQVCLGFEPEHDDAELRGRWAGEVESRGWTLAFNQPFAGSLVPTELHRTDSRVKSLMIELRRDLYMNETTGERTAGFAEVESFMRTIFEIASKR